MLETNIKQMAKENNNFRHVLYTGSFSQLVLMSLGPNEDIGAETHPNNDQLLFIVAGQGIATINDDSKKVEKDSVIFVPAGTKHNLKNNGVEDLKIYTVYGPPAHDDGVIHVTKEDAQRAEKKY